MTTGEAATPAGQELIEIILLIASDGELQQSDVQVLHDYLQRHRVEIPAFVYLRAIVADILQDGRIAAYEVFQLRRAMARVVPKSVREQVTTPLASLGLDYEFDEAPTTRPWHTHPATDRQLAYIQSLGGSIDDVRTKGEAGALIDKLLDEKPPTPRQQMVVLFFDRTDLLTATRDEVSLWLDRLYEERPAYQAAWVRYKRHVGDDGHHVDATRVPVGEYRNWLRSSQAHLNTPRSSGRPLWPAITVLSALLLLAVIYVIARHS